jgi:hypothetical protein
MPLSYRAPERRTLALRLRVKRKDRTILYLIPGAGAFQAAFVLGDRAVATTQSAALPERIHRLIAEARHYAEGTGFRTDVAGDEDLDAV